MNFIKKTPLLLMLISTAALFTVIAAAGKETIYREQTIDFIKEPLCTVVFSGWREGVYPWELADSGIQDEVIQADETVSVNKEEVLQDSTTEEQQKEPEKEPVQVSEKQEHTANVKETPVAAQKPEAQMAEQAEEAVPYSIRNMRLEPLRESTYEEYINHISADIYGDAGVLRAAEYPFVQVEDDYFEDALFIGDSRTVGLHDYTDLKERATFLCETSLTIQKVFEKEYKGMGTLEEVLAEKEFGKIYLMVGINELGLGTTEDYMEKYTEVIDRLHELEPEALLFIQGTMRVSGQKSEEDAIFNNQNINARNHAIATLADNIQVFYIDVNEVVCDENGNLKEEYTFDQIHLLGVYNDIWKEFLMTRGVTE